MTPANRAYVHPLFDANSRYRKGCELSVWSDGGEGSIRRFFEALRLAFLDARWDKDKVDDWGQGDEINQEIHEYRRRVQAVSDRVGRRTEAEVQERVLAGVGDMAPGRPLATPGFFLIDLSVPRPDKPRLQRGPVWAVTGMDPSVRKQIPRIPQFSVKIPELPDGRRCMLLLLTNGLELGNNYANYGIAIAQ